jgi:methyltransferase of ATP-grasp peptide maturase system
VTVDTTETRRLRAELVRALVDAGKLHCAGWLRAFEKVPRHLFVPRFHRYRDADSSWEIIDGSRSEQRDEWLASVYSDEYLYIARDVDDPLLCSTSSMPSIMAEMLEALGAEPGHRVLEIGTGSGYNAALLCEMLGSTNVTTVDIDARLVEAAAERLRRAGYTPTVATGDGFDGYPENAPFDRVIATCRVRQVPTAWITQTRPGGLILAMLPHGMAQLTVAADGSAQGRFHPTPFGFMYMRGHWPPAQSDAELVALTGKGGSTRPADDRDDPVIAEPLPSAFWMLARLAAWGDIAEIDLDPTTDVYVDRADRSWAVLEYEEATITQGGPRRLWDAAVELHQEWSALGRPDRDRLGLTVTAKRRQYVWLDDPQSGRQWDLAGGAEGTWWQPGRWPTREHRAAADHRHASARRHC